MTYHNGVCYEKLIESWCRITYRAKKHVGHQENIILINIHLVIHVFEILAQTLIVEIITIIDRLMPEHYCFIFFRRSAVIVLAQVFIQVNRQQGFAWYSGAIAIVDQEFILSEEFFISQCG